MASFTLVPRCRTVGSHCDLRRSAVRVVFFLAQFLRPRALTFRSTLPKPRQGIFTGLLLMWVLFPVKRTKTQGPKNVRRNAGEEGTSEGADSSLQAVLAVRWRLRLG